MDIKIRRTVISATEPPVKTQGGITPAEAGAEGVRWVRTGFVKDMRIAWNWDDLLQDAMTAGENLNLAMAGLVMSNEVEIAAARGEAVLRELGFGDIRSEHYLFSTKTRNEVSKPARTFGHRAVEKDGKTYHVFCAVFKGTTTLPDTITDVKSVIDGFYDGGRDGAVSLKEYVREFEGADRDNTVLFITGHSLGASTANVTGRLCRNFAREEATFVYSFASPNYETAGEWLSAKRFANFHYYTNRDDVVPKVPPKMPPRFFSKIGLEHLYHYASMGPDQLARFNRAYRYFRGVSFEEDKDLLGLSRREKDDPGYNALKNHLCHTYMAFMLSELTDEAIGCYIDG